MPQLPLGFTLKSPEEEKLPKGFSFEIETELPSGFSLKQQFQPETLAPLPPDVPRETALPDIQQQLQAIPRPEFEAPEQVGVKEPRQFRIEEPSPVEAFADTAKILGSVGAGIGDFYLSAISGAKAILTGFIPAKLAGLSFEESLEEANKLLQEFPSLAANIPEPESEAGKRTLEKIHKGMELVFKVPGEMLAELVPEGFPNTKAVVATLTEGITFGMLHVAEARYKASKKLIEDVKKSGKDLSVEESNKIIADMKGEVKEKLEPDIIVERPLIEAPKPEIKPEPVKEPTKFPLPEKEIAKLEAIKKELPREEKIFYHGTKAPIKDISEISSLSFGDSAALFGEGFYITDNPEVAKSYAKTRGRGAEGKVFPVKIKENLRLLDMEKPLGQKEFDVISRELAEFEEISVDLKHKSGRDVHEALVEAMQSAGETRLNAGEILTDINLSFEKLGYDGLTYVGGRKTTLGRKFGDHNVVVLFDLGGEKPLQGKLEAIKKELPKEIKLEKPTAELFKKESEKKMPGVKPEDKPTDFYAGLPKKQITDFVDRVLVGKPRSEIDANARAIVEKNFTDIDIEKIRTSRFANDLRKNIPENELMDMIFYVDNLRTPETALLGNPFVKNDTYTALSKRLSTKTKLKLNEGRKRYNEAMKKMVDAGLLDESTYLDSYISHLYKTKGVGAELKKFFGARIRTRVPFKGRKIPTFHEAFTKHGLEPKGNFADILEIYENIANKAIINNTMLKTLKDIKVEAEIIGKDGNPATQNIPAIMRIDVARKHGIETGRPNDWTPKGGAWAHVDSPALRRFKAFSKTEKGDLLMQKVGVAVHPDVAYAMRQVFQELDNIPYALELINGLAKTAEVSFSAFHAFALIPESGTAVGRGFGIPFVGKKSGILKPIQTIRNGLERLEKDPLHAELMARARVNIHDAKQMDMSVGKVNEALQSMEKSLENIPIIKSIFKGGVRLKKLNDHLLWEVVHKGIKSELFYRTYTAELKANPTVHPDIIAKKVGAFINDAFGGLDWNTMWNVSPKAQQYMRLLMFSPDWTLAQIRVAGKTLSGDPLTRKLHLRYMIRMAIAYEMFHESINYVTTGHSTFENDPGHEGEVELPWKGEDGRKRYVHAGKQIREVLRWFTDPLEQAGNKLSPVASELFLQVTGATAGGQFPAEFKDKEGFEELVLRLKSAAIKFRPFSLSGGNFALTLPQRKGTSFYRATRDVARILRSSKDLWNNPFKPSVIRLLKAAEENGHDPYTVLSRAKGEVNRDFYKDFFDAFESGDFDRINKSAKKISEFGLVTEKGLNRSLSIRGLNKEQVKEALSAFGKHGFVTKNEILKKYGLDIKEKEKKKRSGSRDIKAQIRRQFKVTK